MGKIKPSIKESKKHRSLWDKDKNGPIVNVGLSSNKKYWWKCLSCKKSRKQTVKSITRNKTNFCRKCWGISCQTEQPIAQEYWRRVTRDARKRNIPFRITVSEAYKIFLKQEKKCALTGDNLILFSNSYKYLQSRACIDNLASLDRIDSSKSYNKNNIQWVRKDVNLLKRNLSDEDLIILCKKIAKHQRRKKVEV